MNLRLNIILIMIVAVLAGWYFGLQNSNQDLNGLIKKAGQPEYIGNKTTTSAYDTNGKPQYFVQADEIKHYEETGQVELMNPLFNLFDSVEALKKWKLTSDNAEITKEKILRLEGNVKIKSLDRLSQLQQIETEQLFVDLNTQDVFTDKKLIAKGIGFSTMGTGLEGNLKKQFVVLKENVKTHIEPTKLKQSEAEY
ncbi:LPS export ABC transporter periplasmic protein LptC [Pasteurella skyensis]|uniref:Lipopolysaccharide export system protein LptC n=1 Tax=Phocoenobacter skyensis TaxID=97481 RepID=A0AAJ6P3E0_9PAST|nr:LPS export ABC transporter periplasmic protein LptC [Pasteurella skyensis]MDP8171441.1 LPS export ABC transporter periplasmic protein LptC [Pasteurella skyensis]MDP8175635.1 LPS export ABC transporter periplasmic protein LptC [Pasteurella skyensis]